MWNGAEPGPEALRFRCPKKDLSSRARDVDIRLLGIIERKAEEWVAIQTADGPLIRVHLLCRNQARPRTNDPCGGVARDRLRSGRVDANGCASLKVGNHFRLPDTAQPYHRRAGKTFDLDARKGLVVGDQPLAGPATCSPRYRRQSANALILNNVWKAGVHHDKAGREPHHHRNADRHSQISMRNNQGAPQAAHNVCHAGHLLFRALRVPEETDFVESAKCSIGQLRGSWRWLHFPA